VLGRADFPVTVVTAVDIRAQTTVLNVVEEDFLIVRHAMGTVTCHAGIAMVQGRYG